MFQQAFQSMIAEMTDDNSLVNSLWKSISARYSSPDRYYHNLKHLDNLLLELEEVKDDIADWETILLAIAYHDIIYIPSNQDNEEASAQYAQTKLAVLGISEVQIQKCASLIIATKGHQYSEDADTNFFTDADLAILGYRSGLYQEYAHAIRKEYIIYPDDSYNKGRKKVLTHFLNTPQIYKTAYFQAKYEQKARRNLLDEYNMLS